MTNYLYITDNDNAIQEKAEQYAKDFNGCCVFDNSKESMKDIINLYNNTDNIVIFVAGLNKSPVSDALLKVLEDSKKNIVMFATTNTYDVKEPLKARFQVLYYDNKDIEKEVIEFIRTRKVSKEIYSSLSFYIALANHTPCMYDLELINMIIKEAKKCTYNTPWDYYFMVLKEWYNVR